MSSDFASGGLSAGLNVIDVRKTFGDVVAVDGVSFDVRPGEILALLGPSGCGKSTTLALVAGLEALDAGSVVWDGRDLAHVPPHARGFGLMFQDFALFPHMDVFDNLAYGLRMLGQHTNDIRRRVDEMLSLVGLTGFEHRAGDELSGGERQRVALARSLAPRPRLLMLDEPLGDLDRTLKEQLILDLPKLLGDLGQTAIYVTHDQVEAFAVADRVLVLNQGRVEQVDTPEDLFGAPATPFVARFLGLDNLLPATIVRQGSAWLAQTELGPFPVQVAAEGPATLLIRPDAARLGGKTGVILAGRVVERSFRGSQLRAVIEGPAESRLTFVFNFWDGFPEVGAEVRLALDPDRAFQVLP
jgi:ABC-type Fe3+/spermidine/putrescine transport system ATPase subunit